jgi:hypothetical protein
MTSTELIIKTRDDYEFKIPINVLLDMEKFMIKNMIEDIDDIDVEIYIDEDYIIIKNIMDSLRYKSLIFDDNTNLRLMNSVCDKWCVPQWLIDCIVNQIYASKKLTNITTFIDSLTNGIYKCKNCNNGFNKFKNKVDSCKYHPYVGTIAGTNIHACCNKEEYCKGGYHYVDMNDLSILIHKIGELGVL